MLRRLFPRIGRHVGGSSIIGSGQDDRRNRRVAHPDVLRVYLRRTLPEGATPAQLVAEVYESMGDHERLGELLANVDDALLEDLLSRLEDYERDSTRPRPRWRLRCCSTSCRGCAKGGAG